MLSSIHSLILITLNMMLQLPLSCAILLWPRFYHSLFKYKEGGSSFWSIVTKPLGTDYRRPVMQWNKITCLNVRYYFHSFYKAKWDYARLHQQSDKDLEDAVSTDTSKLFYDNPFHFSILYTLLLELIPEPLDVTLWSILSVTIILFVYLYPVVRGLIIYWSWSIFDSILSKDNRNMFVRHGIRRCVKCRPIPTLYAISFDIACDHS